MRSKLVIVLLVISLIHFDISAQTGLWPVSSGFTYFGSTSLNQSVPSNYSLLQSNTDGATYLNSPSGIHFRIGNSEMMELTNSGIFYAKNGAVISSPISNVDPNNSWESNLSIRNTTSTANPFSRLTFETNEGGFGTITLKKTDTYSADMYFQVRNGSGYYSTPLFVKSNGNVGIGTTSPAYKLELQTVAPTKAAYFQTTGSWQAIDFSSDGGISKGSLSAVNGVLGIGSAASGTTAFVNVNLSSGNVGIGTTSPNQKLTVNGTIYGKEVKVDLNVPGPDYVFEENYNLPSLTDTENYINQNKHLAEVPSAKEMETNGINLSEMNMILLKKVEELTLHLIEMKKENEAAKVKMNSMQNEINQLKK